MTSRQRRSAHTPAANGSKWIRPSTRWAIYHRDGFVCAYCGRLRNPMTIDHIEGVERGGSNDPMNLITCCLRCNSKKQGINNRAWFKKLRKMGIDTEKMRHRIARLVKKPLDRAVGRYLAATREKHTEE